MDVELIKSLADLPVVAVLIYLLMRAQAANEKLLAGIIESEREHARNLVDIVCNRVLPITGKSGLYSPSRLSDAEISENRN